MDITEEMFLDTKEISIDLTYLQPRIVMMDGKREVICVNCKDKGSAFELFGQLMEKWNEVKRLSAKNT